MSGDLASGDITEDRRDPNAIDELMKSLISAKIFDGAAYGLEGSYAVLQELTGVLESGGSEDRVRLVALRAENGVYDRALLLEVTPGDGGDPFVFHFPQDVDGLDSQIVLEKFVATDKSEILLTIHNSRGERFLIAEIGGGQGNVIYDSAAAQIPSIRGRFIDNFRAEILVEEIGTWSLIDLSARRERYARRSIYIEDAGILRRSVILSRSRSELRPVDADYDGICELKGVIEMSGAGRSDLIAYVEATLKYQEGQWRAFDCWVTPAEDLANMPMPVVIQ